MFYADLTVNKSFYEPLEQISGCTLEVFFVVGFTSVEAASRLEQCRVLMGPWHEAV